MREKLEFYVGLFLHFLTYYTKNTWIFVFQHYIGQERGDSEFGRKLFPTLVEKIISKTCDS